MRAMSRRILAALLPAALLSLALGAAARAHDPGMSVATIVVDARETAIEVSAKGADLGRAAGLQLLDADGMVDAQLLEQARAAISDHLRGVTSVEAVGASCPLSIDSITAARDEVLAVLRAPCGAATAGLVYRTRLLHDILPGTLQNVLLVSGDDAVPVALSSANDSLALSQPVSRSQVFSRYATSGVIHIFIGYDHLAFLFALLLWARRLWPVVKVVTAFTLAHTVTLSLAALDVIVPPTALIEPLIAATIIAAAAENFFNRNIEGRWKTALALGLIHGFGFASALGGLPRDALVIALASFNIGVEIGQVAAVSVFLMILLTLDRVLAQPPAPPTRAPQLVYGLSAPIALLGLYWLAQRSLFV